MTTRSATSIFPTWGRKTTWGKARAASGSGSEGASPGSARGGKRICATRADTLVTRVSLYHRELGLLLVCRDAVDFHENIYLREIDGGEPAPEEREIRLFFGQDFSISGNSVGDTAAFDPETGGIVHYKGARYFLANACVAGMDGSSSSPSDRRTQEGERGPSATPRTASSPATPSPRVRSIRSSLSPSPWRASPQRRILLAGGGENWQEVRQLDALVKHKGAAGT